MQALEKLVATLSTWVWGPLMLTLLVGTGLYLTILLKGLQFRALPHAFKLIWTKDQDHEGDISHFAALMTALAATVGIGNIVGVATAISLGGPGAVFWMWMVAFLGASSAFVESTLGQVYKEKLDGQYRGGPAFYIQHGLGIKWFAWAFAIVTIFATGLLLPGVQANGIASGMQNAWGVQPVVIAPALAIALALIIFGGVKRIATFAEVVVPFMALGYIIVACVIIALNIGQLPGVILLIWKSAFGMEAGFGAILGLAIMWGVKRGVYSNEAAQGTGPHASSAAAVSHPAKQGLVQAFSVYIDTLFVCSATGFMLLITGLYNVQGPDGAALYTGIAGIAAGPGYLQTAM